MTAITIQDLTQGTVEGAGVFDELMRSMKGHLEQEFAKQRIKGTDYANVYLGSLQAMMQYGVQFLLEREQADQRAELLRQQVITEQKQQALLDQQVLNAQAEKLLTEARTAVANAEVTNLGHTGLQIQAQTALIEQQTLNAVKENTKLDKEICKLEAEYDVLMEQKLKTVAETALLTQKKATETAQTTGTGVDPDSVIGRQKALYLAQTDGIQRDAEQKAAKILIDTWNVRRTTDEGTQANVTNQLDDASIGAVVGKLRTGIGA